jgi:hypothetical protein
MPRLRLPEAFLVNTLPETILLNDRSLSAIVGRMRAVTGHPKPAIRCKP